MPAATGLMGLFSRLNGGISNEITLTPDQMVSLKSKIQAELNSLNNLKLRIKNQKSKKRSFLKSQRRNNAPAPPPFKIFRYMAINCGRCFFIYGKNKPAPLAPV
ncbi:hypothetical protein K7R23_24415 [Citrobacter rodentium NBRC 105723 = DSM 16636]|uniref:hypothetical protein n=1 Tax=Citrobacter rodentium TaxID=67825 RepID=UPI00136492B9|nr:hypothetical protein [Citrobacter rodentium]UHO31027.1 hypothetical protein K7R23_24415 [Citrobacter rodentium NBRC 105723 = DSM 16636]